MDNPTPRLFEIPVYRLSKDDWIGESNRLVDERVAKVVRANDAGKHPLSEKEVAREREQANAIEVPHQWNYNDVIGWIVIRRGGPWLVKAYVWVVGRSDRDGTRRARAHYQRGFSPHPFIWGYPGNKVVDVSFTGEETDEYVFQTVRAELVRLASEDVNWLHHRYLDLRCFDTVGPHIRWSGILG